MTAHNSFLSWTTTMANTLHGDLFSSLISDIKTYTGKDPLLPWLRGIRKMMESLPPQLLKEKLPRFLQKCAQTFETDRRYTNDMRYLRVWLQLMDFVDDPRGLLRTMEINHIGEKRALFYQAYALYYEKIKKFEEADKMYHLGVQNLAEPLEELQKSYEQFLHRLERHKNRRIQRQEGRKTNKPPARQEFTETKLDRPSTFCEDPLLVKFLDTAVVGKSEAEDACHHGLVEPTINMKEAMNAINNMFREPLEPAMVGRATRRRPRVDNSLNNGFKVFVDENLDNESFNIFIDEEEANGVGDRNDEKDHLEEESEVQDGTEDSGVNVFVFPSPKDDPSESSDNLHAENSSRPKFREDTVVCRFVGSTILDEPEVENVCHHGLVEPTINLKEAMNDINNMFGKPIEFARKRRPKKQDKVPDTKRDFGFSILPDDDLESQQGRSLPKSSHKSREFDLSEPTVFTKEAMDEINKMFGMPLDF
ncbi:unnamed protein product, partial [Vitis vinifera]